MWGQTKKCDLEPSTVGFGLAHNANKTMINRSYYMYKKFKFYDLVTVTVVSVSNEFSF